MGKCIAVKIFVVFKIKLCTVNICLSVQMGAYEKILQSFEIYIEDLTRVIIPYEIY